MKAAKTVLLANELGQGLGHVGKLVLVGQRLGALGFTPVLALPNRTAAGPMLMLTLTLTPAPTGTQAGAWPWPVVDAPTVAPPPVPRGAPLIGTMAEVLLRAGLRTPEVALPALAAWDALLDDLAPALVVLDFAPFLGLAALGRWPVVALGTGFTLPPPHLPRFPPFGDPAEDEPQPNATLRAALDEIQRQRGRAPLATPGALLAGTCHFVCALPALDPYASWRLAPAVGPLAPAPDPAPEGGAGLVAYLDGGSPRCPDILAGLARTGLPGAGYVRGAERLAGSLDAGPIAWRPGPLPLGPALRDAALVVHHGGLNTLQEALMAGRPQLVLSTNREQSLNGEALERLGAGLLLLSSEQTPERVAAAVRAVAEDGDLATAARARGRELTARYREGSLDQVTSACLRLAAG